MRPCWMLSAAAVAVSLSAVSPLPAQTRLNPVIDLIAKKQPVFGLYGPANRRTRPGQPAPSPDSIKSPAQLATEALGYKKNDYIFDGSMEGDFEAALPQFAAFSKGMVDQESRRASRTRFT